MGKGYLEDGGVLLYVQFTLDFQGNETAELEKWQNAFGRYSLELYRATYGRVFLKQVVFATSLKILNPDVIVNEIDYRPGTYGNISTIEESNTGEISLPRWELLRSGTFVHEFGHYVFFLNDEYDIHIHHRFVPICNTGSSAVNVCIMCFGKYGKNSVPQSDIQIYNEYTVNDFCNVDSHLASSRHPQVGSCWETISALPYEFCQPATFSIEEKPEQAPAMIWTQATNANLLIWHDLDPANDQDFHADWIPAFFLQVLQTKKLGGADLDVSLIDRRGRLLVIGEGTTANEFSTFLSLTAERTTPDAPFGFPGLGAGAAASPSLIIISDRKLSEETTISTRKLIRSTGAATHSVFRGTVADSANWQRITSGSFGQFRWVPTLENSGLQNFVLITQLFELGIAAIGDYHLVRRETGKLPAWKPPPPLDPADESIYLIEQRLLSKRPVDAVARPWHVDTAFLVESGASRTVVTLTSPPGNQLILRLLQPSGAVLSIQNRRAARASSPAGTLQTITIETPAPGRWIARVERKNAKAEVPFCLQVWSQHENVEIKMELRPRRDRLGIDVRAFALGPMPLALTVLPQLTVWQINEQGLPVAESRTTHVLNHLGLGDKRFFVHRPSPNGQFVGSIDVTKPGIYAVLLQVENSGTAIPAVEQGPETDPAANNALPQIPAFCRQVYQQIAI